MLPRLILFLVIAGAGLALTRLWLRRKALALPRVPDDWRQLADRDVRVKEALEIRDALAKQVMRKDNPLSRSIITEVDALVRGIVSLTGVRHQMEAHLTGLDATAHRDADLLSPEAIEAQKAQIESLKDRPRALEAAAAETVHALRQFYLDTLEAMGQLSLDPQEVERRLSAQSRALERHLAAEREIRAMLNREQAP